jgi:uncharacterized protein
MKYRFGDQRVFVDTAAFVALSVRRDSLHQVATSMLRQSTSAHQRMVTTNFVVAETHSLVLARTDRRNALIALDLIDQTVEYVERVLRKDEIQARKILEHYDDKTFSYTDATSFAVMRRLGLTEVFTFDQHFAQFGFSPLKPN